MRKEGIIKMEDPKYILALISWKDDLDSSFEAIFKTNNDIEEEEDCSIFFYGESLENLKSLIGSKETMQDFSILDILKTSNNLEELI